jgi:hypothetical protein
MKSPATHAMRLAALAAILVIATGCGGTKAAVPVAAATSDTAGSTGATPVVSAGAAPVKAVGGGSFCKLYAASVAGAALHPAGAAPQDAKAQIDLARAEAHQALSLAPSQVKDDVSLLVGVSDQMYAALAKVGYDYTKLTAADMGVFSTPQVSAAEAHLTAYITTTCGLDLPARAASGTSVEAATSSGAEAATSDGSGAGKACTLVTAEQVSTAAGKPMHSVGGAGDTICVFSAVDDPSFAMEVTIYDDEPSMATMTQLETEGSEHLDSLGDDAFWNPTLGTVFVKKGTRAFSFSLPSFANLTDKPAAIKDNMVALGHEALGNF